MTPSRRLVLPLLLALTAGAGSAGAAVRHVKAGASGANDGTSWANAYVDLQSALAAATSGDEIWVAAGTYKPTAATDRSVSFSMKSGVAIYGGFAGSETALTERNVKLNTTVLSGEIGAAGTSDNSYRIVSASSITSATLDGFTLSAGNNSIAGGAAAYVQSSNVVLRNLVVVANQSASAGGAFDLSAGTATVEGTIFRNNSSGNYGGAVLASGGGSFTFTNCVFTGNTANSAGGGAIAVLNATTSVVNGTIIGNSAAFSGGLHFHNFGGSLTVRNSILRGNSPSQVAGPGSSTVTYSNVQGGFSGTGNIDADPLFATSWNFRLTAGSPCIDAADNAAVSGGVTTDLDGNARFLDDPARTDTGSGTPPIADMGAYERVVSATYPITVSKSGGGTGVVTSTPAGIDCGATCTASFTAFSTVQLTASADPGFSFLGWSGDCSGIGTCSVTMTAAAEVTAIFGTVIYVDAGATGLNNGTSWANAYVSLQTALTNAVSGTAIWVAEGTYKPAATSDRTASFVLKSGVAVIGGFEGTETSESQRNHATHVVTLSGDIGSGGNADNSYHVVRDNGASGAIVDGVTIADGNANGSGQDSIAGGVVLTGTPIFVNCTITRNAATSPPSGGTSTGTAIFTNVTVSYNTRGGLSVSGTNTFIDSTFTGNSGGAALSAGGTATIRGCTFLSNSDATGAGTLNLSGTHTVTSSAFLGNVNTTSAAIAGSGATATIMTSLFAGNRSQFGSAIHASSAITVVNSTFTANTATSGGTFCRGGGTLLVRNSVVWGNSGVACSGGEPAFTYSDVQGGAAGTGNIDADPLFLNPQNPGDYRLGPNSPAIDAGDNGLVPASATTDFAGNARFVDDPARPDTGAGTPPLVDMGAYEFNGAPAGFNLAVATAGQGGGRITSAPAGIDCRTFCSADFVAATVVTLTPIADAGMTFSGWAGDCTGAGACNVTMSAARSVTAMFSPLRYVRAGASGANDGTSWADAHTTLEGALAASSAGTELWIAAGTYTPGSSRSSTFTLKDGLGVYGGFDGSETSRSQRDLVSNRTILSGEIGAAGNADNTYHVVFADSSITASTVLDGLTITGGNANTSTFPDGVGGGLHSQGSPTIRNCVFVDNATASTANNYGGAVYIGGTSSITNSVFAHNSSTYGSAVFAQAATIANCTFASNSTGTVVQASGAMTIVSSILWGNFAGAIGTFSLTPVVTYSVVEGGYSGTGNLNVDPLFSDAGARDFRLSAGSPALNSGSNAGVPSTITTDADGFARIVDTTVDRGAYERGGHKVIVTKYGSGSGTVMSAPAAIDCGSTCSATPSGQITLTATPSSGWFFNGWGGACAGVGTCVVTGPAHVTARFGRRWYVNAFASGNDGTSWMTAFTDLQSAFAAASPGDEIWVAAASYKPSQTGNRDGTFALENGVHVYGGFAGTETLRTQRNAAVNVTTLNGDNGYNVVTAINVDAGALLDGFTVTGGNANSSTFGDRRSAGGGIHFNASRARVTSCTITGNSGYYGGAIWITGTGSPALTNCVLSANTATPGSGGAIRLYGASGATVTGCTFTNNSGVVPVLAAETSSFTFTGCDIVGNTSTYTPLYFYNNPGVQAAMVFSNTLFRDNSGPTASAVYTQQSSPQFINCTFTRNTSGPALRTESTPAAVVTNSILWGNDSGVSGSPSITYSGVQGGFPGAGNINADPLFLNAAGGNLRLTGSSPANDAGNNVAAASLSTDYEGKPRRSNAPVADSGAGAPPIVDMGAYEFHPVTVSAPANANACAGGSASFSVTASGWGALSHQWRKNGTPVGPNAPSFTIDPVTGDSGGSYDVVVTDSIGTTATSSAATMTVDAPPSISTGPGDQTICSGGTAAFSVTAGGAALTYQWRRNGTPIDGANAATYQITGAVPANNGTYDVVVTGTCAPPATSAPATLVVDTPPQVSAHPSNVTVCAGQEATFQVTANGAGATYQWRRNGTPIGGATSATYAIPSASTAHAGSYDVVVTGTCSPPATSNAATLVVNTIATVNAHPQNVTVCRNQPAQFSVNVSGVGLTYQWRRNMVPIDGATSTTYSIASALASQAGSYDVVISSACAAPVTSNAATLTVQTPPEIDVPPANQTVCQGQQVQLSVIATGTNVGYQWRKGGQDIDGAIQSTYTIPSAAAVHAGNYDVVLTGTCGTLTSTIAVVVVSSQPSISSFAPLSGSAGTQVTISGAGLTGASVVTFNGATATFTVSGDTQITATVPAGATSGPISVAKGGCATATSSGGFTVVGGFGAPANLLATATSGTQVFISWSAVANANHYEVWRQTSGAGFILHAQSIGNAYADSCGSGVTCVYKVRAVDAAGTMSVFSNVDLATTLFFTDDPLVAGTTVKAAHWTEMRAAVNAVRAAAGLAPAMFTDAALMGIAPKAVHLSELRAALDPARGAVGAAQVTYAGIASPGVPIRASHLVELRSGVK